MELQFSGSQRRYSVHEIDTAMATFPREQPDALFVSACPFFTDRRVQLAQLATHYMVPAT
jgi:hypothetical protein